MPVHDDIEQMRSRIVQGENATISGKIELYSCGISAKIKNAEYALSMLNQLASLSDTISSSGITTFGILDKTHFYIDSFFAFTYSAFDVMAQVINQKLHMGKNEWDVNINKIKSDINRNHSAHTLNSVLNTLFNRNYFKNLKRYRNCSTHRRQIYIQEQVSSVTSTPGYSTSGNVTTIVKILCDNPLTLNPTINQNRELIRYCTDIYNKMCRDISQIASSI